MFYKEIVDYIQSKVDDSICKHCDEKTMTIGEMQKEQMNLEQKLNRSIKKKDDELKMFKQKIESLEKKSRDAELRATQDIQKKDEELNILRQEKESLKNRKAEIPEKEEVDEPDQETEIQYPGLPQFSFRTSQYPGTPQFPYGTSPYLDVGPPQYSSYGTSQTPSRSPNYSSYGRRVYPEDQDIPAETKTEKDKGVEEKADHKCTRRCRRGCDKS